MHIACVFPMIVSLPFARANALTFNLWHLAEKIGRELCNFYGMLRQLISQEEIFPATFEIKASGEIRVKWMYFV
jgi:hypothetical protein